MHRLVSPFILDRYAAGETSGRLHAASLFVDVSGFSALTSKLMAHGQNGAEVLATVMRAVFDPLVEAVYAYGGFITVFAGDAFTALFPDDAETNRRLAFTRALAAAWTMRQHMYAHPTHETPYGQFSLAAKIGLAIGDVEWGILRTEDDTRATFYFRGDAIDTCAQAAQGDLVLHPSIAGLLNDTVLSEPLADCLLVTDLTVPLPKPQSIHLPPISPDILARFFPPRVIEQSLSGEFRQVINVFVGLQGEPTAERLRQFLHAVFKLQTKYGGLLNRLDFGDKGCNLLLFWGAPVAHENDLLRALNFLLELHDVVHTPIRAGVTSHISHAGFIGSSLHEEYTCYGNGVNLAARLMTTAPWESIWLDESVRVRAESHFELVPEGHLPFKGFSEEQAVYSLLGHKNVDRQDFYSRPMVGRARELDILTEFVSLLFQPAHTKRFAGILVVRGEAGLGKSRLVHDFQTQHLKAITTTVDLAPRWCLCQSDQIVRQSLNPFRYWLQDYLGQSSTQSEAHNKRVFSHHLSQLIQATTDLALKQELDRTRSILGALVGLSWEDSLYATLDPQSRYESTLGALKAFILAESLRQPVVLYLEDIHWLDEDSIQFVKRLVRDIESYPLAIIATTRPEGSAPFADIEYQTLELSGLSRADLAALASNVLAKTAAPKLLDLLEERACGNPFFAEQILFYLRDEKFLEVSDVGVTLCEAALLATPLPTSVRAIFIARLDRLALDVREVVQTAAVLGREFEVRVLTQMLHDQTLRRKIAVAENSAIWTALTELRYLFKHVLLRDAAYDMQVQARRAELHQLAAEAMETLYATDLTAHYVEIAYHYEAACLAGLENLSTQARMYLTKAGTQSVSRFENTAAIEYFTRASRLTPESDWAGHYVLRLAREAVYDKRGDRAPQLQDIIALEELAEALNDDHRRAEAALRRANYGERISNFGMAITSAKKAVTLAQAASDVTREAEGHFLRGTALWRRSDYLPAKASLEQALSLAQGANLVDVEANVHLVLGFIAQEQGAWAEVQGQIELALPIYRAQGDLAGEMAAVNTLGINCHEQADYAGARTYFEQALGLARQAGRRLSEARYLNNLANAWQGLGNWAKARTYLEQALRVCQEIGHRDGEAVIYNNLATLSTKQGDLVRAASGFEQALAILREVVHRSQESETLAYLGLCQFFLGDYEAARENCERALQIAHELGSRSLEGMPLTNLGHALVGLGQLDEARQAYQAAVEVREVLNQLDAAMEARAGLARVALAQDDLTTALNQIQIIADYVQTKGGTNVITSHGLAGAEDPLWVWLTWHQVWAAAGDPRAVDVLTQAYAILQTELARIEDPEARRMYVENIPSRREIVAVYEARTGDE